jgi:beta-lactamase class A
MIRLLSALLASTALASALPPPAGAAHAATQAETQAEASALEARIAALAELSGGRMGVMAFNLDGGEPVSLNPDEPFPMASTFKIAVAATVLARVDAGELALDDMIEIDPGSHVMSEVIADRFIHPGVALSVANLIELTITQSDNTATDVLTGLAGGPEAVTAWLSGQGIEGQRVDRDTAGLLRDFFDLPAGPLRETLPAALAAQPDLLARGARPHDPFDTDPRDTSTPRAMAELLARIARGQALSEAGTDFLMGALGRTRTGAGRLKGLLPEGTPVAHKTGTIGGTVNDAGVITLPDGRRIVVAAFVKQSDAPMAARERAIAEIARTLHDGFALR